LSSLDWTSHINLISRKVNKTVGIMKYVSNNLPDNILWSLYFTLVNPHYDIMNMVLLYGLLKYSSLAKIISQKSNSDDYKFFTRFFAASVYFN